MAGSTERADCAFLRLDDLSRRARRPERWRALTRPTARSASQLRDERRIHDTVLRQSHDKKRAAKRTLLDDVKKWCDSNPEEAKAEFRQSAAEIVDALKAIDHALFD
jgi:hypothetical protein